jgi:hypothetical protein
MKAVLVGFIVAVFSTSAFADCVDWKSYSSYPDLKYRLCAGNFRYAGGARQYYFQFMNDGSSTLKVRCTVTYADGDGTERQDNGIFATMQPGQVDKDGGNYIIAKEPKSILCQIN